MTGDFHKVRESTIQWVKSAPGQSKLRRGVKNKNRKTILTEKEGSNADNDPYPCTHGSGSVWEETWVGPFISSPLWSSRIQ